MQIAQLQNLAAANLDFRKWETLARSVGVWLKSGAGCIIRHHLGPSFVSVWVQVTAQFFQLKLYQTFFPEQF